MVILDDKITNDNYTNESKILCTGGKEDKTCRERQINVIGQDILALTRDNPPSLCLNQQQSLVPSSSTVSDPSSV
jgi:hypothetical protein